MYKVWLLRNISFDMQKFALHISKAFCLINAFEKFQ